MTKKPSKDLILPFKSEIKPIFSFAEFEDYTKSLTASFQVEEENKMPLYAFGVLEEAGEVAGKFKRSLRGEAVNANDILLEMGDLLAYLSLLAGELGSDLGQVAALNREKMEKRKAKKTLFGAGDNR